MTSIASMIENTVRDIEREGTICLDDCRMREDLMALFKDIRDELKERSPQKQRLLYEYSTLLQQQSELYSPSQAYEAGALLATNPQGTDTERDRAFMRYICRLGFDPEVKKLQSAIQKMYDELTELLDETRGLLSDFTELHRKCYGIVSDHISHFFFMGYDMIENGMNRSA